ncbi:TPA: lytic transglycosylase domain-containing protein [Pseudomonas aeruginosa]
MANYDAWIEEASRAHNVDPGLVRLLIGQESRGDPNAVSPKGARGLGQLMPATAAELGVDPTDPRQNIFGTARYLSQQLDRFGSVPLALAAYNAGPGTVERVGGIPNYPETQNYVKDIMAKYQGAQPAYEPSSASVSEALARLNGAPEAGPSGEGYQPSSQAVADALSMLSAPVDEKVSAPVAPTPPGKGLGDRLKDLNTAINAPAVGFFRGVREIADAPSEWLAKGSEAAGITDALKSLGIDMLTGEEQLAANKARRAGYANESGSELAGRVLGNIAGVMVPMAGAESALAGGGNALLGTLSNSPRAASALQGVGNFVSGQGGALSKAAYGAAQGAGSAALMSGASDSPLENQVGAGAAIGAVAGPIVSALANPVSRLVSRARGAVTPNSAIQNNADEVMERVRVTLEGGGTDLSQIPQGILRGVRTQVEDALRAGRQIDPAALARQAEFEALGIQPTLGQLTRDAGQFTAERNMRGIAGAGEPLAQRFAEQNNQLMQVLGRMGGADAVEADAAGNALVNRLQALDMPRSEAVNQAYQSARDSAGRYANIDVPTFSQAANQALDENMLGRWLPGQVRDMLNDISSGRIPLNVNTAVQVDSVMSEAQRAATWAGDTAAARAVGVVRDALQAAPVEEGAGAAARAQFDAARGLARARFAEIEGIPALRAALDDARPDTFVKNYILNGDPRGVTALGRYIAEDPAAMQTARSQIAAHLQEKAFGRNTAGDATFRQDAYNKALQQIGTNKLSAFFSPEEVQRLRLVGRVGANINAQPVGSAVNNSNTAAAAMNLLSEMGGFSSYPGINVVRESFRTFSNERAARNALLPRLGRGQSDPADANALIRLLTSGSNLLLNSDKTTRQRKQQK